MNALIPEDEIDPDTEAALDAAPSLSEPQSEHLFIATCRKICKDCQYMKYDGKLIDILSASYVVAVWDVVTSEQKAIILKCLESKGPIATIGLCMRAVGNGNKK